MRACLRIIRFYVFGVGNVPSKIEKALEHKSLFWVILKFGRPQPPVASGSEPTPLVFALTRTYTWIRFRVSRRGWREGSAARSVCCSCRGPERSSLHPQWLTTIFSSPPRDLMPSSPRGHLYSCVQNTQN